jgi:uncharacterized LabA/DUF88 family protein
MERIIAYIDGYNLYHGLKESKLRKFYWLDVKKLIESILRPDQTLVHVNYFTSRVSDPPTKVKRQNTYLEALATLSKVHIHYGHYVVSKQTCRTCGVTQASRREKRTDVNIAAVMLFDAFKDHCDNAILVSADTDLLGPLYVMKQMFPHKKRTLAFPPGRYSDHLTKAASGWLHIGEDKFARSLLPPEVTSKNGFKLTKPTYWP